MMALLLALFLAFVPFSTAEILEQPQSVNTTVNSSVYFNCSGEGTSVLWLVNKSLINSGAQYDITYMHSSDGSIISSTLQILKAVPNFNNSNISCRLEVSGNNFLPSRIAVLLLQGTLTPPANLTAIISNGSLQLSWNPPVTSLHGVPILYYSIMITDLVIDSTSHYNITSQTISLPKDDTHCYTVNVSAVNSEEHGMGGSLLVFKDDVNLTVHSLSIAYDDTVTVKLLTQVNLICPSMAVNISLRSTDNSYIETANIINESTPIVTVFHQVPANDRFPIDVILYTIGGYWSKSLITNISTYDVRRVEQGTQQGTYCYRCIFITDSQARGCLIHLHGNSTDTPPLTVLTSLRLLLNDTLSEWSCYQKHHNPQWVVVYDIEKYSRTSINPALVMPIDQLPMTIIPAVPTQSKVSSTNSIIIETSPLLLISTILPSFTSSLISSFHSISSSSTSVSSFTSSSSSSSSLYIGSTNAPPPLINTTTDNSYILPVILTIMGLSFILVLCLILAVIILIACIRKQKVKIKDLRMTTISTNLNPIYSTTTLPYSIVDIEEKKLDLGTTPSNPVPQGHIYNEVHKNDWIPNPTYGQAAIGPEDPDAHSTFAAENKIYDSPKHQPLEVPILTACVAYDQPPVLPTARQLKQ